MSHIMIEIDFLVRLAVRADARALGVVLLDRDFFDAGVVGRR